MDFETTIDISFGDCDPAQLVFYPNYFAWFDRVYHAFLKSRGIDHGSLREKLGAAGTGLMEAGASFRAPATNGDRLTVKLAVHTWRDKTVRLAYEGRVGNRLVVEGFEIRGLFVRVDGALKAAPIAPLKALLEQSALT